MTVDHEKQLEPDHAGTVAALADRGADVDRLDDRGRSPLSGATVKGEPEVVGTLPGHGADPDVGSSNARETAAMLGQTALLEPRSDEP